ncbi:hypothetical protein KC953_02135 [Candidatus Saccharibacteria bacterium]|nr:hypothetical protein [Candidatus Saccharibacteria bacterium]
MAQKVSKFEQALDALSMASWNRARSTNELRSFLDRREAVLETVDIDL